MSHLVDVFISHGQRDVAQSGDWADITNIDRTGFDVTIRNGVTAQSGRHIDYHAKGYGVVIP
jgi:hypothetical protein